MTTLTYNQRQGARGNIRSLPARIAQSVSAFIANYAVALAWSSGRRAHPADLERAGFTPEFEAQVLEAVNSTPLSSR